MNDELSIDSRHNCWSKKNCWFEFDFVFEAGMSALNYDKHGTESLEAWDDGEHLTEYDLGRQGRGSKSFAHPIGLTGWRGGIMESFVRRVNSVGTRERSDQKRSKAVDETIERGLEKCQRLLCFSTRDFEHRTSPVSLGCETKNWTTSKATTSTHEEAKSSQVVGVNLRRREGGRSGKEKFKERGSEKLKGSSSWRLQLCEVRAWLWKEAPLLRFPLPFLSLFLTPPSNKTTNTRRRGISKNENKPTEWFWDFFVRLKIEAKLAQPTKGKSRLQNPSVFWVNFFVIYAKGNLTTITYQAWHFPCCSPTLPCVFIFCSPHARAWMSCSSWLFD